MTTVEQAEKLVLAEAKDFGTAIIAFDQALGRVLAEDIKADRDLPPFNRVTMDGIAVSYAAIEKGISSFHIKATQAAGDQPIEIQNPEECIEIMTGAALPGSADTVIPYEHIEINNGKAAVIASGTKKGQNLHLKGVDKKEGEVIIIAHQVVTPGMINAIASVGKTHLLVAKPPRVVSISSGDELVDIDAGPSPTQIRKSNSYTIRAVLSQHSVKAELLHIPDNPEVTRQKIGYCLENYDVILMTGGISMGKFDYIPNALDEMGVK